MTKSELAALEAQYSACTEFEFEDVIANPECNYYLVTKNTTGEYGQPVCVAYKYAPISSNQSMIIE